MFKKGQKNEKGNEKYVPLWRMGKEEEGRKRKREKVNNVEEGTSKRGNGKKGLCGLSQNFGRKRTMFGVSLTFVDTVDSFPWSAE